MILYTSADSVLQLAAHDDRVPEAELHAACEAAREVMRGEHAVGRVIARPFTGRAGRVHAHRRPARLLARAAAALVPRRDAGRGRAGPRGRQDPRPLRRRRHRPQAHRRRRTRTALAATTALLRELDAGLVFTNLVETDQVYGHRHDSRASHGALEAIDAAVAGWLDELLGPDDLLILTADHGVDPTAPHTDHTREYAPLIAVFDGDGGRRHDGPLADVGASTLEWLTGGGVPDLPGESFVGPDAGGRPAARVG